VTTERGHRLQPELRICCDPRQSGPEATLAHADGRAVRGYGRTARPGPSWPCGCPPHRRAPRTHRCGHSGTRTQNARTPTRDTGHPHPDIGQPTRGHRIRGHWTVTPDTRHWTPDAWSDRVRGQGDQTRKASRTDFLDDHDFPTARWDARTGDLWTAPAAPGNDEGSATVRYLPARDYLPRYQAPARSLRRPSQAAPWRIALLM